MENKESSPSDFLSLTLTELKSIKSNLIKRDGTPYPVTNQEIIQKAVWCKAKSIISLEFSREENIDILIYVLRRNYPADYSKRSCILTDRQINDTIKNIKEMKQLGVFTVAINKAIAESYKQLYIPNNIPNNSYSNSSDDWKRTNDNIYEGKL